MNRLLAAPDASTPAGRRDRAILELFYASGLRLAELCDIDLEDISLNRRTVRVRGKGGKERLVPFNGATATAVKGMLADRPSSIVDRPSSRTRDPGLCRQDHGPRTTDPGREPLLRPPPRV